MVSLVIQDLRFDDKFYDIECEHDSSVEDLKCLITLESQVEVEKQELFFSQQLLQRDAAKLNELSINHGDMINMGVT